MVLVPTRLVTYSVSVTDCVCVQITGEDGKQKDGSYYREELLFIDRR